MLYTAREIIGDLIDEKKESKTYIIEMSELPDELKDHVMGGIQANKMYFNLTFDGTKFDEKEGLELLKKYVSELKIKRMHLSSSQMEELNVE
jgi:hypothetical protein